MDKLFISIPFTDLASRHAAADLRREILEAVSLGVTVHLDFSKVQCLAGSYADELFGILALELGLEHLFARVKVKSALPQIKRSIVVAIRRRVSAESLSAALPALVAAKVENTTTALFA